MVKSYRKLYFRYLIDQLLIYVYSKKKDVKRLLLIVLFIIITARILQQLSIRTNQKQTNEVKIGQKSLQNEVNFEGRKSAILACNGAFYTYRDENLLNFPDVEDANFSNHGRVFDKPFFLKKGLIFWTNSLVCRISSSIDVWKGVFNSAKQGLFEVVASSIDQTFYSSISDLISSLILGRNATDEVGNITLFNITGTQHLLAISGFHLTFFAAYVETLYGKFFSKSTTIWLNLLLSWGYACLVGFSPGLFRAFLMFSISSLAWLFNRQKRAIYSLFLAFIIAIICDIQVLLSIGFQLSYLATLGIIVISGSLGWFLQPQDSFFVHLPRVSSGIWMRDIVN